MRKRNQIQVFHFQKCFSSTLSGQSFTLSQVLTSSISLLLNRKSIQAPVFTKVILFLSHRAVSPYILCADPCSAFQSWKSNSASLTEANSFKGLRRAIIFPLKFLFSSYTSLAPCGSFTWCQSSHPLTSGALRDVSRLFTCGAQSSIQHEYALDTGTNEQ